MTKNFSNIQNTKMRRYKLIVFDLDGTLVDTSEGIINCHIYANKIMNRPLKEGSISKAIIGGSLLKVYEDNFGYNNQEAEKAIKIFRDYYRKIGYKQCKLYPGIKECLIALKLNGFQLAVVTLKEKNLAKLVLNFLGIDTFFEVIYGTTDLSVIEKYEMLNMCMRELKIEQYNTLLIGDSENDALSAKKAGIDFIGVLYGYGLTENKNDNYVVKNCIQLINLLINNQI